MADILLEDGQGFSGTIAEADWPIVGERVVVRKSTAPKGPWEGEVLAFKRAQRCAVEWVLASGEVRSAVEYRVDMAAVAVGEKIDLKAFGRSYEGVYKTVDEAACVTVRYVIQSGASRRRDLYFIGRLPGYFRPKPDGGAVMVVWRDKG